MPMVSEQQVKIETHEGPVIITAASLLPCNDLADVRFASVQLWEAARAEDRPRLLRASAMHWQDTLADANQWRVVKSGLLQEFVVRWHDLAAKEAELT